MTSGTGRGEGKVTLSRSRGFTLVEVLLSFAILTTGLILIVGLFSRHLSTLRFLELSLKAFHQADRILLREGIRRQVGLTSLREPLAAEEPAVTFRTFSFDQEPVKDLLVEEATSEVSWSHRGIPRQTRMISGFQPEGGGT